MVNSKVWFQTPKDCVLRSGLIAMQETSCTIKFRPVIIARFLKASAIERISQVQCLFINIFSQSASINAWANGMSTMSFTFIQSVATLAHTNALLAPSPDRIYSSKKLVNIVNVILIQIATECNSNKPSTATVITTNWINILWLGTWNRLLFQQINHVWAITSIQCRRFRLCHQWIRHTICPSLKSTTCEYPEWSSQQQTESKSSRRL